MKSYYLSAAKPGISRLCLADFIVFSTLLAVVWCSAHSVYQMCRGEEQKKQYAVTSKTPPPPPPPPPPPHGW
jgi:hypothetical protein